MPTDLSAQNDARRYVRIGKYEVLSHIATGGMGAVYKARDTDLGRDVALKILSPELSAHPLRLERFRREARHSARLSHENIVNIYEIGEANGVYFLALEYVDGPDLFEYIQEHGPLDPEQARLLLIQAVRAVAHAHNQGIVHRDIKPPNMLLTLKEDHISLKLTDFGVAREASDEEFRVTLAGNTVGTVDYMAPEQARDSRLADIRSDIYSLGCTFFHMLAGRAPFAQGSLTERVLKHCEQPPPDIRRFNAQVPDHLVKVMARMLAKKPSERYQSPKELLHDLTNPLKIGQPHKQEPTGKVGNPVGASRLARTSGGVVKPTGGKKDIDTPSQVPISSEQQAAAARQYERAKEALAASNEEYAIQLLLSCCKLDVGNLLYRRALRRTETVLAKQGKGSGRFSWLGTLGIKTRLRKAKRAGDHRKVLVYGEEVLARNVEDTSVMAEMADAAEQLGEIRLAIWLMDQARRGDPQNIAHLRASARLYEKDSNYGRAIEMWERVNKADPSDGEAHRKVRELAANETIARGNFTELLDGARDARHTDADDF